MGWTVPSSLLACMTVISTVSWTQRAADVVRIHDSRGAYWHIGHRDAFALQLGAGIQHRGMLDGAGDHVLRGPSERAITA